jgi:ureidoglycolate hydrolase
MMLHYLPFLVYVFPRCSSNRYSRLKSVEAESHKSISYNHNMLHAEIHTWQYVHKYVAVEYYNCILGNSIDGEDSITFYNSGLLLLVFPIFQTKI